jgi:hypothetical protein
MIKPFSGEVMRQPLENILRRKKAFERTYRHFEDHHLEHAITACEELIREKPKYAVDALRFKGECLNALGRFDEAEALYKQIIAMRAIPWRGWVWRGRCITSRRTPRRMSCCATSWMRPRKWWPPTTSWPMCVWRKRMSPAPRLPSRPASASPPTPCGDNRSWAICAG